MTSAFICYSRKDKEVAEYIAAELTNRNAEPFIDYMSLRAGGFMKQLGRAIEQRDFFLPIISPDSVESDWVEAEVTWAFTNKKPIIPIRYKSARLTNVFVLDSRESVDFGRWHTDRNMDDAIGRLMKLMNITVEPTNLEEVPEPILVKGDVRNDGTDENNINCEVIPAKPTFTRGDVQRIFETAASVQDVDPEQALYLYRQVLEFDSGFMNGKIKSFIKRQEKNLKSARLELLEERIESSKKQGNWYEVMQLANTMLDIDPENQYAPEQMSIADSISECEPIYEQAKVVREHSNEEALSVLMADIQVTCPDYGDPAGLLTNQPIRRPFVKYVRNMHTLEGHAGAVRRIAFSNNGVMLATASSDASVKVWSVASGDQILDITSRFGYARALAFSPDDRYIAIGSSNGQIELIDVESQTIVASESIGPALHDVEFAAGGKILIACGQGVLTILQVPDMKVQKDIELAAGFSYASSLVAHDCIAYSSVIGRDCSILRWNIRQGQLTSHLTFQRRGYRLSRIRELTLSHDGEHLAATGQEPYVWQTANGESLCNYSQQGAGYDVSDLTFSSVDSSLIVLAGGSNGENSLHYFDISEKKLLLSQNVHDGVVNAVAMSPNGRSIATGSDDWTAKIWQL